MAINWGGLGNSLGGGLQQIANVFLQKAMMERQPQMELEALKKKAYGLAEMTTPNWSVISPEMQDKAAGDLMKQMMIKPSFASEMGQGMMGGLASMMGMGGGALSGDNGMGAQPGGMPIPPRQVSPLGKITPPPAATIGAPKFQNQLWDPEDGAPFTVNTYADFQKAIKMGALTKAPETLPGVGDGTLPGM